MKKTLLFIAVLFMTLSMSAQAEEISFRDELELEAMQHEQYLEEIEHLSESEPTFSFADKFCEDYEIESYRELEKIYDIYSVANSYDMDSYNKIEDAIISHFILKEELGEDLVDELLDFQEQHGYGSIEKLLNAADEIGYGELTGDYSYIHTESKKANPSSEDNATPIKYTFTDKVKDKLCVFWDNFGFFIMLFIGSLAFMYISFLVYEFYQKIKKNRK